MRLRMAQRGWRRSRHSVTPGPVLKSLTLDICAAEAVDGRRYEV